LSNFKNRLVVLIMVPLIINVLNTFNQVEIVFAQGTGNVNSSVTIQKDDSTIKPVSPEEMSEKIAGLVDATYNGLSKSVKKISKIMIALSGIMLLAGLFIGVKILVRAAVGVASASLGLLLFSNAEAFLGLITWASKFLKQ